MVTAAPSAARVECEVDGAAVPVVRIPQCRTCRSRRRREVEVALAQGGSYTEVAAMHPEAGLTPRNLAEHHRRGHLPLKSPELKEIIAARAAGHRFVLEVAVDRQATALKLASAVVERAQERLAAGEIQPTFGEAVAASRVLAQYDQAVLERDRLREQLRRAQKDLAEVFRLVSDVVSDEQWSELGRRFQADPEMRTLWPPLWR